MQAAHSLDLRARDEAGDGISRSAWRYFGAKQAADDVARLRLDLVFAPDICWQEALQQRLPRRERQVLDERWQRL